MAGPFGYHFPHMVMDRDMMAGPFGYHFPHMMMDIDMMAGPLGYRWKRPQLWPGPFSGFRSHASCVRFGQILFGAAGVG